jgi:dTMP kinase
VSGARGRLIAFEGGEATGKSTQAARLAGRLGAVLTREPGGTSFGAGLRAILLDPATGPIDPRAEALLLAADRAQHVADVIEPALARGLDVVTDRYIGSSLAYQAHGRGLPVEDVQRLSAWATGDLEADAVVLLIVPAEETERRLGPERDRLEGAGGAFHQRVAEGYLALAAADARWVVVDGCGEPDAVEQRVWLALVGQGIMPG